MTGYTYIVASKKNGTIYIGVTSDLSRRVHEHRIGLIKGFTRDMAASASFGTKSISISATRLSAKSP